MWFLQTADLFGAGAGGAAGGGLIAFLMGMLIFAIIFAIIGYIYMSLAFMAIARKARYPNPAYAWIPFVGPGLIASKTANMHWWPLLLIIVGFIPIIGTLASLVLLVFSIIWMWKTFEVIGKPNWWAILLLIPIVNIVILGIAAWSKK